MKIERRTARELRSNHAKEIDLETAAHEPPSSGPLGRFHERYEDTSNAEHLVPKRKRGEFLCWET